VQQQEQSRLGVRRHLREGDAHSPLRASARKRGGHRSLEVEGPPQARLDQLERDEAAAWQQLVGAEEDPAFGHVFDLAGEAAVERAHVGHHAPGADARVLASLGQAPSSREAAARKALPPGFRSYQRRA